LNAMLMLLGVFPLIVGRITDFYGQFGGSRVLYLLSRHHVVI